MNDLSQRAATSELQRRTFAFDEIEIRSDGDDGFEFEGVASVVDHPYTVRDQWGEYTEIIRSGAFNHSLKNEKAHIGLYLNHGWRFGQSAMATNAAGTLKLWADPNLHVRGHLDPVRSDVQIAASMMRRGEAKEMSVGFAVVKARDVWNKDMSEVTRTQVSLKEVSIVEQGANTGGTSATMRAFDQFMQSLVDVEMDEADLRRAIAHFESMLPATAAEEVREAINEFAERDRERLERKRHCPV
jgi:HK97 family phage prohead protease